MVLTGSHTLTGLINMAWRIEYIGLGQGNVLPWGERQKKSGHSYQERNKLVPES